MANYEATRYDFDGAYLTGIEGVNTGIVVPWGSASIPSGFLLCDGQAVSQATYAALFAIIGTTYGDPGGGNFNVPDLRDRTICGSSSANSKNLAQGIGANTVTPTGNIGGSVANATLSTAQLASHNHALRKQQPGSAQQYVGVSSPCMCQQQGAGTDNNVIQAAGSGQGHSHNLSANFSGSANSVLQPTLVLNYIIKT
jgi:microcystin-dependent protein